MSKARTIRFRLDQDKIDALDAIAESLNRDRGSLLGEAVANYLELHTYQTDLITKGLLAVKLKRTMGADEVRTRIASLARARRYQ